MQAPNSTSHDIEKPQDQERERTTENIHSENCCHRVPLWPKKIRRTEWIPPDPIREGRVRRALRTS